LWIKGNGGGQGGEYHSPGEESRWGKKGAIHKPYIGGFSIRAIREKTNKKEEEGKIRDNRERGKKEIRGGGVKRKLSKGYDQL